MECILWCLRYLFSSFKILRNFSALVTTVLAFSCSLAASSSFNFSDFFKAVHWQGKVGRIFPSLISMRACIQQEMWSWRRLNFITYETILFSYSKFSITVLSNETRRENILHVAMIERYSYQLCQDQNTNQQWCVFYPRGAFLSTQCKEG